MRASLSCLRLKHFLEILMIPLAGIILFTGFQDRSLVLRVILLDVLPPSVCDIFRSGPSGTLQLRWGKGVGLQRRRRCRSSSTSSPWVISVSAAGALCLQWQLLRCGRGREPDSKSADVVLEVRLLPPRRWVVSVSAASALCLKWQLQRCGRGREPDSKSADEIGRAHV